mgnify:CR=1 FL=1
MSSAYYPSLVWRLTFMRKKNNRTEANHEESLTSKTQRKKEVEKIRSLGEKLCELTDEQLIPLRYPALLTAIKEYRKITKGNARKRQLQYIGKQLRNVDLDPVIRIIERYDSSSRSHLLKMKRLESWRDGLLSDETATLAQIAVDFPNFDRQALRRLVQEAGREALLRETNPAIPPTSFRKIFQYLKALDDLT